MRSNRQNLTQKACLGLLWRYRNLFSVHPFFVIGTTNLSIFSHFCNYESAADVIGHDVIGQSDQKIETGWATLQGIEVRLELPGLNKKKWPNL